MAEYYGIHNVVEHDPIHIARLLFGLRADSRVKMKISGVDHNDDILLKALIYDRVAELLWVNTYDKNKNNEPPESLYEKLLGRNKKERKKDIRTFRTPEEYETELRRLRGAE